MRLVGVHGNYVYQWEHDVYTAHGGPWSRLCAKERSGSVQSVESKLAFQNMSSSVRIVDPARKKGFSTLSNFPQLVKCQTRPKTAGNKGNVFEYPETYTAVYRFRPIFVDFCV
jgi:hypothetical protein